MGKGIQAEGRRRRRVLNCDLSDPELNRGPREGHGFVYMYTFENGMRYIGQTIQSVQKRTRCHAYRTQRVLRVDQAIMAGERFTVEILEEVPLALLDTVERYYVYYYGTKSPNGYNLTSGGQSHMTFMPEVRKAMGRKVRKYFEDHPEQKKKNAERLDAYRKYTKVICLETKEVFNSINDACRAYVNEGCRANTTALMQVLKGERYVYRGMHWMVYTDYIEENTEEILAVLEDWKRTNRRRIYNKYVKTRSPMFGTNQKKYRVLCLETGKVYKDCVTAAKHFGFSVNAVLRAMKGETYGATHKRGSNNTLHFIQYSDYAYENTGEVLQCLKDWEEIKKSVTRCRLKVRCMENGIVYESTTQAGRHLGISSNLIRGVISGKHRQTHGYHFEEVEI